MSLTSLFTFLCNNELTAENEGFIRKELGIIEAEAWMAGYHVCLQHRKKHAIIKEKRRNLRLKRFLDFLSDLTHNPKKV